MMKKFLTIAILLMMLLPCGQGQAPQKMTAQMVLRDANGLLIANQQVSVRISIRRTLPAGITVYSETHTATTNANGLYTVFVGEGMPTVGTFGTIDWGNGPYYIASEVDPAGGTNYTLQTVQQLVSVPYALYADSAYRCAEHQVLTLSHDTLRLTGGSFVRLPQSVSQRYVDSVVAANRVSTVRLDSLRRANDSIAHRYDSVFNVMRQRLDSVVAAGGSSSGGTGGGSTPSPTPGPTPNPSCTGLNTTGSESRTECDRYTWPVNNQTYTATTTATGTIYGGNAVGCDSTVTLALTIKQGSYNSYSQTSSTSYTWHGTSYSATGTYTYSYTNSVGCPSVDTLHLTVSTTPTPVAGCSCSVASSGALPGKFSVSTTQKVKFSQGNLQYQASTNTWRFAQCQKQYMDTNNKHVSSTYTGWIDLFCWGTSGFHNPADNLNVYYRPYDVATVNNPANNYTGYGPSINLTDKNLT
ncbi:MAG: hypothetical protein IJ620_06700 [Bacteroidales bacterium]|nr:hypothetical protein [Bacteroidales bacterium]